MTPYRFPADVPSPPRAAPARRIWWVWRTFAFALCWALRLRVALSLNFPAERVDLSIVDGWSNDDAGAHVAMPIGEFDRLAAYILLHPLGVPLQIVTQAIVTETLHVPPAMLPSLKMVVAAAWLDLQDRLHAASVVTHTRPVWISYSERLLLQAWRS